MVLTGAISDKNLQVIRDFLVDNGIKEVWGAWGNKNGIQTLVKGKEELIIMLRELGIKVFYYGTLTKAGNPRNPLQRQEKWDFADKKYYF